MFRKFFSLSNPVGLAITAATLVLTLSPEARRGTRKLLVKGTAAVLSIGDHVRELTGGARKQLGSFVDEAKEERERLPDMSEMMRETGETMKDTMGDMVGKMKQTVQKTSAFAMESADEMVDDFPREENKWIKKTKQTKQQAPVQNYQQVHSVLSDEAIRRQLNNIEQ